MKNRKRVLAILLAGFLSVTTAFQTTTAVAFATEGTEMTVVTESSTAVSEEEQTATEAGDEVIAADTQAEGDESALEKESADSEKTEGEADAVAEAETAEAADAEKTAAKADEEKSLTDAKEADKTSESAAESDDKKEAETEVTAISEVRAAAAGTTFTVKGVVNYVSGKNVYVQDETGAICLYLKTADQAIKVGNLLTATGAVKDYNGLCELDGAVVVENDADNTAVFDFITINANGFAAFVKDYESYECQKVVLKGVKILDMSLLAKGKVDVGVDGAKALVYDKKLSDIIKDTEFAVGDTVELTAVVTDYKGIELLPITDADHPYIVKVDEESGDDEPTEVTVDDSVTLSVASFAGTDLKAHSTDLVIFGDKNTANDFADTDNMVTAYKGGSQVAPVYNYKNNGTEYSILGSVGFVAGDYYQFTLSGSGYGLYQISFSTKGSGTGAKNWKASYSTDGENYTEVGDAIVVGSNWEEKTVAIPAEVKHVEKLYFRVGPSDNTSINGKTVGTGGVNRLNDVKVTGSPVMAADITAPVDVEPESGEAIVGQELTMSCATKSATILYQINDGEFIAYNDAEKPVLTAESFVTASELDVVKKATVTVYATCEGHKDSVKKSYVYTQAKVGTVKASPNGGAIRKSQAITLATETKEAKIVYSLDKGETWIEYTEPFKLAELPATVQAKATCEGYEDSAVASFDFTERVNEEYNIYFGQLHSHTSYSDGAGTCDEAFNHAANEVENLDFLAVTDHSNSFDNDTSATITDGSASKEWLEGHELADKYTSEDFVGLYGYEMTWSGGAPGHMNTFNTDGFMSRNMTGYESKSRVALQNYYAQLVNTPDSISMFNHPGTTFGDFYDFAYYSKANDRQITLIEVGNGEGPIGAAGYFPSYEYYTRALDKGWHVAPANNQDNHKGRWGDANTGRTVILADSLSRENIYDAIRNMRVYATEDNDLKIYYTLNGVEMGTILDMMPEEVNIKVKTSDPTDSSRMTVEVIANGGVTVASQTVDESSAETEFTLSPNYSYYYIRVTQADGNIAVTAPVWLSDVEALGVSGLSVDTALPVVGEELTVSANFFNNESSDFEVSSIVYSANGGVVHTTDVSGELATIKSQGETTDSFKFLCEEAGRTTIEVTLLGYLGGVSKKYTASMDLVYVTSDMVTNVVVDGTHLNDYVTGYYSGNVGNFADIAASDYVKVDVVTTEITREKLADCSVLVISAPNKNTKNGEIKHFEDSFVELVKEYVAAGGNLIICGLADYQDTKDGQSSTELNKILEAIGATTRINSDEVVDEKNNGGQEYRLYPTNFNRDCYLVKGVSETQKYSAYSGCSVLVDETAVAEGRAEVVVSGFDTTYTKDCKQFDEYYKEVPQGNVVFAAREALSSGCELLVTGTVFLSNFEVKTDLDYGGDEYYANRNILLNYLAANRKEVKVSTIAELRAGKYGDIFTVEGYVTAGTAVEGNKFFDTIYIQDETAGTTVFPVADAGIAVGTKVRVTGLVDGYQGDKEIQIYSYKILDEEKKVIEPRKVTTKEAADYDALGGSLLKVEGKVTRIVENSSGLDYFYVVDESGVEARVFIDGYILASDGNDTTAEDVKVGNTVSAVGLSYYNPDGACLRVRDRAEIELVNVIPEKKASLVTKWGTTYYVTEDGEKLTGFQYIDGKEYYFGKNGGMVKQAWVIVDGVRYYAKGDGVLAKNEMIDKWGTTYVFDANGVLQTGLFDFDGASYYSKDSGALVKKAWVTVGDKKYYALAEGVLAKDMMVTKWTSTYIFNEDGVMETGFVTFEGNRYYCKDNGVMVKSDWIKVDSDKYYAKADGTLAIDETIKKWGIKYTFDKDGKLIK